MVKIIYKVCDISNAGGNHWRPLNLNKLDLIKVSSRSLKDCFSGDGHEFHIVGDRVSDSTIDLLKDILNPKSITNYSEPLGNMKMFVKASEIGMTFDDNDMLFFTEDDYVYDKSTFGSKLNDFINFADKNINQPWFIHPTDYPDQYAHFLARNYIFQTKRGYWREVSHSTGTFMCYKKYYKLFNEFIDECCNSGQGDGMMSTIFKDKALCFSPMPSIGAHLHHGTMPMYVDWESLIKTYLY